MPVPPLRGTSGLSSGLVSEDPVREETEALYGLPPGEFTGARNAAAARLRQDGDRAASDRVRALRKPTVAAWVVNLLVRHEPEQMGGLLDLGESLRQAQADLDGDTLRDLGRQRRRLVAAVAARGRALARESGAAVSESVLRQVEDTLHAAMVDTDAEAAVRTGMLVDPLSPTGTGSLKVAGAVSGHTALGGGALTSPGPARPARPAPKPDLAVVRRTEEDRAAQRREEQRRARAEARRAVKAAEGERSVAARRLASREQHVGDLQARTLQVNGEIDELRRRVAGLEDRLERLDDELAAAEADREEAAEEVARAESQVAAAQEALEALDDPETQDGPADPDA